MESLNLIKNDPWLAPYKEAIEGRYQYVIDKEKSLTNNGKQTLAEMASGYLYFGLHKTNKGWVFREWPRMPQLSILSVHLMTGRKTNDIK